MVKLIERVLHCRITIWMTDNLILSPNQIGFRANCSIWCAHADLESRIQLARKRREYSALMKLDIAKAYDSVEHSILLDILQRRNFPYYITAWVAEFCDQENFIALRTDVLRLNSDKLAEFPKDLSYPQYCLIY